MRSLRDLKELMYLFPPRDAQRDTYSIFGSKFVYTVIEDKSPEENILSASGINRMARLHKFVLGLQVRDARSSDDIDWFQTRDGDTVASNCLRNKDDEACTMHPIAFALEDETPVSFLQFSQSPSSTQEFAIQFLLRYPNLKFGDFTIDNAMVFGGVRIKPNAMDREGNAPIQSSKAVRLTYILKTSESTERCLKNSINLTQRLLDGSMFSWLQSHNMKKKTLQFSGPLQKVWLKKWSETGSFWFPGCRGLL